MDVQQRFLGRLRDGVADIDRNARFTGELGIETSGCCGVADVHDVSTIQCGQAVDPTVPRQLHEQIEAFGPAAVRLARDELVRAVLEDEELGATGKTK
jgi:hypothetical protein